MLSFRPQMAERDPLRDLQARISAPGRGPVCRSPARRVAMSPRNFFRVFMREVGMTPGRFVERVRVETARRLLEETSRDVPARRRVRVRQSGDHARGVSAHARDQPEGLSQSLRHNGGLVVGGTEGGAIMADVTLTTIVGDATSSKNSAIAEYKLHVRGELLGPRIAATTTLAGFGTR